MFWKFGQYFGSLTNILGLWPIFWEFDQFLGDCPIFWEFGQKIGTLVNNLEVGQYFGSLTNILGLRPIFGLDSRFIILIAKAAFRDFQTPFLSRP